MSAIEIGLSMLYCLRYPFSYMIEQLGKIEVEYVEILDESHHALSSRRIKIIKDISRDRNLKLTVHAPFVDINIASPDPSFRRLALKRLSRSMALASQLGARFWVFHPGLRTGVSHFHPGNDWMLNVESVLKLIEVAVKNDLTISIENTPEPFPFILKSVNDFARFYKDLGVVNLGLTLDIAHANVSHQIFDFIKQFAGKIIHAHASDNDGTFDSHLGIGEGNIEWTKVAESFRNIDYAGVVVVESEREAESSVKRLKYIFSRDPTAGPHNPSFLCSN